MSIRNVLDDTWNRFNHLARRENLSTNDWIQIFLQMGLDALDVDLGIISHVNGQNYAIEYSTHRKFTNKTLDLSQTYCEMTLARNSLLYLSHDDASLKYHPAHEIIEIEEYIGIPLVINGQVYGTLCFFRVEARSHSLTQEDAKFVMKSAQVVTNALNEMLTSVA